MNILRSIGLLVAFVICHHLNGQDCLSFTDSIYLHDQIDTTITFTIYNLDSTDLTSNQEVCGVNIHFGTEYPRDLQIVLESPSGDQVTLIGPIINNSNDVLIGTSWNISFVPLDTTPVPDAGYSSTWSNDQGWVGGLFGFAQIYTGSYHPNFGALGQFNSGHAYGEWKLKIFDGLPFHDSYIKSFSIELCNPGRIDCSECLLTADTLVATTVELCTGDPGLAFELDQFFTDTTTLDNLEDSILFKSVIVQNDTVIQYQSDTIDLTEYPAGDYDIFGLYHLAADSLKVPKALGTFTIDSLRRMQDSFPRLFCGATTSDSIHVIIRPLHITSLNESLCFKDSLVIGDSTWTSSGMYSIILPDQYGCDSTIMIDLTIDARILTIIDTTLCFGDSLLANNVWYTESINKLDTLQAENGCDSILLINLIIKDYNIIQLNRKICAGDSFSLFSETYTMTGTYRDSSITSLGCDSIVILDLEVVSEFYIDTTAIICTGDSFLVGDQVYKDMGLYIDTIPSSLGCDSIIDLELVVIDPIRTTLIDTLCFGDSIQVGDIYYSLAGNYTDTLESSIGCDSIVELDLTIRLINSSLQSATICFGDSALSAGKYYTDAGIYIDTLSDINSCDSIITLDLSVRPENRVFVQDTICFSDSYIVGDSIYTVAGNYITILQDNNTCDSIVELELHVLPEFQVDTMSTICLGDSIVIGSQVYKSTGMFSDTLVSSIGCDSVVNLNLIVIDPIQTILIETLCFGDSIQVGDTYYLSTGNYVDTLESSIGCDSIVNLGLTIRPINSSFQNTTICFGDSALSAGKYYKDVGIYIDTLIDINSCDSIITLDLTVNLENRAFVEDTICSGDSYIVGDSIYTAAGNYITILQDENTCDSIVELELHVLPEFQVDTMSTICLGDSIVIGSQVYKSTGMFSDTLVSSIGCDSIVNLNLIVIDPVQTILIETLCFGDSILLGDTYYLSTGNYVDTLESSIGCDSIVNLELTIREINTSFQNTTICFGDSALSAGKYYRDIGIYIDTLIDINSCDSIITLDLTVNLENRAFVEDTICSGDSYIVGDSIYTSAGNYLTILQDNNTCDSIVELELHVLPVFQVDTMSTICLGDSIVIASQVYKSSGIFSDTLVSSFGCDSVVNLELIVIDPIQTILIETLCFGDSIQVGDTYYLSTGNYTDTLMSSIGCDSIVRLDLSIRPQSESIQTATICFGDSVLSANKYYSETGVYTDTISDINSCDSIVTLNLSVRSENLISISDTICFANSYIVGDSVYSATGTYTTIFEDVNMCDSIVILNLVVDNQVIGFIDTTICLGDSVEYNGSYFKNSGEFNIIYNRQNLCDSTLVLNLNVLDPVHSFLSETICEGDVYTVESSEYMIQGSFVDTLTSSSGCDSIVHLDLFVNEVFHTNIPTAICDGDSINFDNNWLKVTGLYYDTLTSQTGCDSIIQFDLAVLSLNDPIRLSEEICQGDSIFFDDRYIVDEGFYADTLQTSLSCDSVVVLELSIVDDILINQPSSICLGDTLIFDGVELVSSGSYPFTYQTESGCDSTVLVNLEVNTCPIQLDVSENSPTCKGISDGSVQLNVDYGSAPYDITLYDQSDGSIVTQQVISDFGGSAEILNLDFGNYTLAVIDEDEDSVGMQILFPTQSPILFTNISTSDYNGYGVTCISDANGSISFELEGGLEPYSILWNDGAGGLERSNLTAGIYSAFIQDDNGCLDTLHAQISAPDTIRFSLEIIPTSCQQNNDGSLMVTNVSGGVGGYAYSLGDGFQIENIFSELASGDYSVAIMDGNACEVEQQFEIAEPLSFIFDLGPDLTLDAFGVVTLNILTNRTPQSITWKPPQGISCLDCLNPEITVTASTVLRAEAIDEFGCMVEDELIILVDIDRSVDPAMAFTPNGDNNNDIFIVHGNSTIDLIKNIEIFDRTGALVFKQEAFPINDPNFGWDGTFKGQTLNTQMLVYFIEVLYLDGKSKIFSGEISLIR